MELIWGAGMRERIRKELLSRSPHEHGGAVFARFDRTNLDPRLLAIAYALPDDTEVDVTGPDVLRIDPSFWARVAKQARQQKLSVLPIHTHPGQKGQPSFSSTDIAGERRLLPVLERQSSQPTGALVVGDEKESVGVWIDSNDRETGHCRDVGTAPQRIEEHARKVDPMFSRNVLAFGEEGQARLSSLRVGVVGASGTGSHIFEQLVRLGVGEIVVIDSDHVEDVNLNRIVIASRCDARRKRRKATVAARYAKKVSKSTKVTAIHGDVCETDIACSLFEVDVLFSCTDSVSSRAVLNRLSIQRFIPLWDCGTEISTANADRLRAFANVRLVLPGSACLVCMGVIDPELLRIELLPADERQREQGLGYIRGGDIPAPAVVSLNGIAASLAAMRFLEWAVGNPPQSSAQWVYRSFAGDVRQVSAKQNPDCPVCGATGRLGRSELDLRL
jgi:molybdopterin-synthase adenylyltransferase